MTSLIHKIIVSVLKRHKNVLKEKQQQQEFPL